MRSPSFGLLLTTLLLPPAFAQQVIAPLVGVVTDPTGTPLPGVTIVVATCEGSGFVCLDLELAHSWLPIARTRTDKAGRFGLQLPVGASLRIDVDQPPFALWRHEDVLPGGELHIALAEPSSFRGRLLRASTKQGTPGSLRLWQRETGSELAKGVTDAEGYFVFDRLPAESFVCEVSPLHAQAPDWFSGTLEPGHPLVHDFELEDGITVSGTVRDAATGKPIAGARIGQGWVLGRAVTTDAAGHYEFEGFGAPGYPDLHCTSGPHVRQEARPEPGHGPVTVDFAMSPGATVTGRVEDESGHAVANVYVAVVSGFYSCIPWQTTRTAADGSFQCRGVPPGAEAVLMLRHPGQASAVYALPNIGDDLQLDVATMTLQRANLARGVLSDASGQPVAGARIALRGVNRDFDRMAASPTSWGLLQNYLGQRHTRTNQRGEFAFGDLGPGDYFVAAGDYRDQTIAPDAEVAIHLTGAREAPPIKLKQ